MNGGSETAKCKLRLDIIAFECAILKKDDAPSHTSCLNCLGVVIKLQNEVEMDDTVNIYDKKCKF